jgi:beta-aspartyl-peptidase (threonine type)
MGQGAASGGGGWRIVIHGGAGVIVPGKITEAQDARVRQGLTAALDAGASSLESGGSALDAVEVAVRLLEDDPQFNAGHGSVLTGDGQIDLDAAIMDGSTRAAGAVAGTRYTRNPISLARAVMEQSAHVFLCGDGADAFSRAQELEQVPTDYFVTEERKRQLQIFNGGDVSALDLEYKFGTVGAVALDMHGKVASATSTGGMTGKKWGRIGDTPVIGAGTYADGRAGAVSATGWGEYFIRVGVAHEICARMRLCGESAQQAAESALQDVHALGGQGGVIFVTPDGDFGWGFNTPGMYRGMASPDGRRVALYADSDER